jgi:thymidine phosphorylase
MMVEKDTVFSPLHAPESRERSLSRFYEVVNVGGKASFVMIPRYPTGVPFVLKIFLDRNGFVAIISTEAVDIIEMEAGLSDETVNTGEIRGKADAGVGSPLRGGAHLAEGHRRATGDL